jgi:hypothetical protein
MNLYTNNCCLQLTQTLRPALPTNVHEQYWSGSRHRQILDVQCSGLYVKALGVNARVPIEASRLPRTASCYASNFRQRTGIRSQSLGESEKKGRKSETLRSAALGLRIRCKNQDHERRAMDSPARFSVPLPRACAQERSTATCRVQGQRNCAPMAVFTSRQILHRFELQEDTVTSTSTESKNAQAAELAWHLGRRRGRILCASGGGGGRTGTAAAGLVFIPRDRLFRTLLLLLDLHPPPPPPAAAATSALFPPIPPGPCIRRRLAARHQKSIVRLEITQCTESGRGADWAGPWGST